MTSWLSVFSSCFYLKGKSLNTRYENSKSRTTQLSPITPYAANFVPITHHANNLGPITRHRKSLCTITTGDQTNMKICYEQWFVDIEVVIGNDNMTSLSMIYLHSSYFSSLGVFYHNRSPQQFSSNTCLSIREVSAKFEIFLGEFFIVRNRVKPGQS